MPSTTEQLQTNGWSLADKTRSSMKATKKSKKQATPMGIEPTTFGDVRFQTENQRATIAPRGLFRKYRILLQITSAVYSFRNVKPYLESAKKRPLAAWSEHHTFAGKEGHTPPLAPQKRNVRGVYNPART
jgi:hypothetical protein